MSTMISAVKKTDYAHEFFERMRSSNPNHIIKEQVQRIEDVFAASGVIFFGSLLDMKREKVCTLLREAQPPLDETWAATIEQFMDTKFKADADTEESPTVSTGAAGVPRGEVAAPKLVSPGKPVVMLGAMLTHANRLYEIKLVFTKEQFLEIFIANPQIFDGEALKPKMDEKITDICILLAAIKWGILNWDKVFCNLLAGILRDFGFRLPKRGSTPGESQAQLCIHAYAHARIHMRIHTYIHAHMHTCLHAYAHAYSMHTHTYIRTYIRARLHPRLQARLRLRAQLQGVVRPEQDPQGSWRRWALQDGVRAGPRGLHGGHRPLAGEGLDGDRRQEQVGAVRRGGPQGQEHAAGGAREDVP